MEEQGIEYKKTWRQALTNNHFSTILRERLPVLPVLPGASFLSFAKPSTLRRRAKQIETPSRRPGFSSETPNLPATNSQYYKTQKPGAQPVSNMCKYYAHDFKCKHTSYSFARFCRDANLIQTPCADRDVWQTIRMDDPCEQCKPWFDSASSASHRERTRHAVRRSRS